MGAEAELTELQSAYDSVWEELQQQRAATTAAAAQCDALRLELTRRSSAAAEDAVAAACLAT